MDRKLATKKILACAVGLTLPSIIAASCTKEVEDAPQKLSESAPSVAQYRARALRAADDRNWEVAERLYQNAITKAQSNNDDGLELAGTLNDYAAMCCKSSDNSQAKDVSSKSLAVSQKAIDNPNFAKQTKALQDNWLMERARSLFVLANTERELGNYDQSEKDFQQVFALQKRLGDRLKDLPIEEEHQSLELLLNRQKGLDARISMQQYHMQWKKEHHYDDYKKQHDQLIDAITAGNVGEVERLDPIALTLAASRFGKQSEEYNLAHTQIAGFYQQHHLYDRAIAHFAGHAKELEPMVSPKHKSEAGFDKNIERLRVDLVALSDIYTAQGKRDQCLNVLEKAIAFTKLQAGDTSAAQSDLSSLIGKQYDTLGQKQTAEKYFKTAMKLKLACYGNRSIEYAHALCDLGALYVTEKRVAEAKPMLEQAQSIFTGTTGGDAPTRGYISQTIGDFLMLEGKSAQALPFLRTAVEEISKWSSAKDIAVAWYHFGLVNHNVGDMNEAKSSLEESVRIFNTGGLPNCNEFVSACCLLAQCYSETHEEKRAEPLLKQAIAASKEMHDAQLQQICLAQYKAFLQSQGRK